mmetsp:Transcript_19401/g.32004  ORF Transcript_19401/g.32004 Transcript_19401/m.32004 type:complete len:156 (+) Transcript_19401:76-543(+)
MSKMEDLKEYIDPKNWECLNAQKQHQLPNALFKDRDDEKKVLKSDSDAQLLIRITFGAFVKIKAIKITAPTDSGPSSIKLFVNPGSLEFEGAEEEEPTQEIKLEQDDLKKDAKPKTVKLVKFSKVFCNLFCKHPPVRDSFILGFDIGDFCPRKSR